MADVCTLIVITTINAIGCGLPPSCDKEPVDGKIFCTPYMMMSCPIPKPSYECKKEDGTTYIFVKDDK